MPLFVRSFRRYPPIFRHITLWQEFIRRSTDPQPISTRLPAFDSPFLWRSDAPKIGTIGSPGVAQSCLPATLPPPTSFLNFLRSYLHGFWAVLDESSTIWFALRSPFHPHHCHTTDGPPLSPVVIGFQLRFPLSFLLFLGQWRHLVAFHWCHSNAKPASLPSWQHHPNAASHPPFSIPLWLLSKDLLRVSPWDSCEVRPWACYSPYVPPHRHHVGSGRAEPCCGGETLV